MDNKTLTAHILFSVSIDEMIRWLAMCKSNCRKDTIHQLLANLGTES